MKWVMKNGETSTKGVLNSHTHSRPIANEGTKQGLTWFFQWSKSVYDANEQMVHFLDAPLT